MELVRTSEFRSNYSELLRMGFKKAHLDNEIGTVADYLLSGRMMPEDYDDHKLEDNLSDFRELHLEGNLLVLCRVPPKRVTLANIGTHSMLFRTRRRKQVKGNKRGRFWSVFF